MKKNLIVLFISFFLLLFPVTTYADDGGFNIEKYDVKINVNENNVLNVKETITVNFTQYRHGIYRQIPVNNTVYRDGLEMSNKAILKNLKVSDTYSKTKEDGFYKIKIGDKDKTIIGEKIYVLEYDYDLGDDNYEKSDDLYFNIIGDRWNTTINNITFEVDMPKSFDKEKLYFYKGSYGSTDNNVNYDVVGNKIIGNTSNFYSYQALTIRLLLDEGYFQNERRVFDFTRIIVIFNALSALLFLVLSTIIFFTKGKRQTRDVVVEYTVPDNLTPSEIGYLYKGRVENNQITSLITYLASKGYIHIIESKKNDFSLKKNKPIDEKMPEHVKITFNGIFKYANKYDVVKKHNLENSFYTTLSKAKLNLQRQYNVHSKGYHLSNTISVFSILNIILGSILLCFTTYRLTYDNLNSSLFGIFVFLSLVNFVLAIIYMVKSDNRSDETLDLYFKTVGFREFLKTVEKEKLELMAKENASLFYDILPYAYVLGVSDVWSKKFESITVEPPEWYSSNSFDNAFNAVMFNNSLNRTLTQASRVMASSPQSTSSSSSGGGFSGGGSGGGGGGSW